MPVRITKLKGGRVRVSTPGGVKSKSTTPAKAKRQRNLLNAIENDPSFKPRKQRKRK